jgi:hypothetical protein
MLGRQLVQTACTSASQPSALMRMVSGLYLSSCWGIFTEMSDLTLQALSVLVEHVRLLHIRVRARVKPSLRSYGLAAIAAMRTPWAAGSPANGAADAAGAAAAEDSFHLADMPLVSAMPFAVFGTLTSSRSSSLSAEQRSAFRAIHVRREVQQGKGRGPSEEVATGSEFDVADSHPHSPPPNSLR